MSSTALVIIGLVVAVLVLVLFTVKLKIHPFFALIATSATFAIVSGMNMEDMLSAFTSGMGGTIADIGLVIALGTVTGTLLENPALPRPWPRPSSRSRAKSTLLLAWPSLVTSFPSLSSVIPLSSC